MKRVKNFQIVSIIFVWIAGTLLHFTHDWFPDSVVFSIISAVNESTWEHLKLVFFPMLFMTIVGYFYNKDIKFFICKICINIYSYVFYCCFLLYVYRSYRKKFCSIGYWKFFCCSSFRRILCI